MIAFRGFCVVMSWLAVLGGAGIGAFVFVTGMLAANGAPQQGAIAASACACAILPYCFARAVTEIIDVIVFHPDPRSRPPEPQADYHYKQL